MELGRLFGENEARTRRVVETALYEPARFIFHPRVPESEAFTARVELLGSIRPGRVSYEHQGEVATIEPAPADFKVYGDRTYYETPNSTSVAIPNPSTGRVDEYVITRGIRPYKNRIHPQAGVFNRPDGYVSDLLLFKRGESGALEFQHRLLDSVPEKGFFFEDPRISIVGSKIFLSGTDYSRHVPGDSGLYIRNGYLSLVLDPATGTPLPIAVNARTGKPKFHYLSPAPVLASSDRAVGLDAKNAVIAQREDGKIVVRTRLRPDFANDPTVARYREKYGDRVPRWAYGVQTFVFDDLAHLQRWDFKNALDLLFASHLGVEPFSPRRAKDPLSTKIVMTERSLVDFYDEAQRVKDKPLGFGPGTRPLRLEREGDRLYLSDGPGMPRHLAGRVPASLSGSFVVGDGEVLFLSFDHKLRHLQIPEAGAEKRVYSGTVTLWEKDLESVRVLYDDVVQPIHAHQVGLSGIVDLHHAAYHMGAMILPAAREDELATLRVTAGEADAHTASYDWDLGKLLAEMSPGSARRESGQVYVPGAP